MSYWDQLPPDPPADLVVELTLLTVVVSLVVLAASFL